MVTNIIDLSTTAGIKNHPMPFVRIELAVLSVIEEHLVVLLGKRGGAPYAGRWALPGGVLRIDLDRDLDDAAQRVSKERLGVGLPYLRQLKAVGSEKRDPRASWALSIAYRALLPIETVNAEPGKRIEELKWFPAEAAAVDRKLAFDHADLIGQAVLATREELERLELPFGFLPEKFTLGELQACCASILNRRLDKSSFRRRLDEKNLLEAVPGEMRVGAFRPAQLYRKR